MTDHRVVGKHPVAGCQLVEDVARKTGTHYLMEQGCAGASHHY